METLEFWFICSADNCPHRGVARSFEVPAVPTSDGVAYLPGTAFCTGGGHPHRASDPLPWRDEVEFLWDRDHNRAAPSALR